MENERLRAGAEICHRIGGSSNLWRANQMDKTSEIEQYFAFWKEPFPVAAEHDHWVRRGKLLRVWLPGIDVPMNVEAAGDFPRGLKKRTPLDLELRFLFLKGSFYKDEAEYYREDKSHMAAESYIPCGTFSPTNDPDFVESPTVLMRGTVLFAEAAALDGDKIFKIDLRFDKCVFRVLALDGFGGHGIREDNILSGFFHVLGKVKRREE